MENEEQIKEYIENKEEEIKDDSIVGALKDFKDSLLGQEKKENDDGPKLFEWLKNDEKLLKYAELQMKVNEAELKANAKVERLSFGEKLKLEVDKAKMELLGLGLSITCPYFKDFQDFLERLKHRDDVGWNTETNTMIMPDYSGESDQPFTNIALEIDESDVAEIAHLGCPNWQNRSRGEKLEVNKEQRIKFLFPEGLPKNKNEMESKYLTTITVSILDEQGNIQNKELQVHKKLAKNYEAVFKELLANGVKVDAKATGAYCWRKIRRGNKLSEHSYGSAIDVNWTVNGGVYGETDKNSIYYNNQTTVEIFKKYGFAWGGDRSVQSDDPMHFTYLGG